MSIYELFIVLIVSLLVLKVEDIPVIMQQLGKIISKLTNTKELFISSIKKNIYNDNYSKSLEELNQINHYINEIVKLKGKYEGEYSLEYLKKHYLELVKENCKDKIE